VTAVVLNVTTNLLDATAVAASASVVGEKSRMIPLVYGPNRHVIDVLAPDGTSLSHYVLVLHRSLPSPAPQLFSLTSLSIFLEASETAAELHPMFHLSQRSYLVKAHQGANMVRVSALASPFSAAVVRGQAVSSDNPSLTLPLVPDTASGPNDIDIQVVSSLGEAVDYVVLVLVPLPLAVDSKDARTQPRSRSLLFNCILFI